MMKLNELSPFSRKTFKVLVVDYLSDIDDVFGSDVEADEEY